MRPMSDRNIKRAIALADELLLLSWKGQAESRDLGCASLFGVVRDCGYRVRAEAEREKAAHALRVTRRRGGT